MVLHRLKGHDRSRRTDSSAKGYCIGSNMGSDVDDGVAALNQAKRGGEIRTLMRAKFPEIRRDEVPLETGKGAVWGFDALGFHCPNIGQSTEQPCGSPTKGPSRDSVEEGGQLPQLRAFSSAPVLGHRTTWGCTGPRAEQICVVSAKTDSGAK